MSEDKEIECIPDSAEQCEGCHYDFVCCKNCIICQIEEEEDENEENSSFDGEFEY